MRWGGLLIDPDQPAQIGWYAVCGVCCKVYQDAINRSGDVRCPDCGGAVVRGLTKQKAREYIDEDQKELLS